jgi:hypothetical protein
VAEAFLDAALHPPSATGRAALIGAADGFFFLGILGLVGGMLLGLSGRSAGELLVPIVGGSLLLVGGAIFFGTLAYALTNHAASFLYGIAGCLAGGLIAESLLGSGYFYFGAVPGLVVAQLLCRTVRRYSPKFQSPHIGNTMRQARADANTDITGSPPPHANDDFFHKPEGTG